jgi:N-acetylmuramoyl-L-alanine amidase
MQIIQAFLPLGPARKGIKLDKVDGIVLHWPDAPNQTAEETRDFWAGSDNVQGDSANAVVSENGVIIQCMPWDEVAYHVGSSRPDPASGRIYTDLARQMFGYYALNPATTSPNHVLIGIEMETIDEDGTMTPETVEGTEELCAYLCNLCHLDPASRIITHHDVVGWKDCHRWYVNHPEDLDAFRAAVAAKMAEPGEEGAA